MPPWRWPRRNRSGRTSARPGCKSRKLKTTWFGAQTPCLSKRSRLPRGVCVFSLGGEHEPTGWLQRGWARFWFPFNQSQTGTKRNWPETFKRKARVTKSATPFPPFGPSALRPFGPSRGRGEADGQAFRDVRPGGCHPAPWPQAPL